MDNTPISCHLLGRLYSVDGKQLQQQYKDHLSDFHGWEQKDHADKWMLFEDSKRLYKLFVCIQNVKNFGYQLGTETIG